MVHPSRCLSILDSEISNLTLTLKRGQLWSRSQESTSSLHPALLQAFLDLKRQLAPYKSACATSGDLDLDPNLFLGPFLEVIRSEVVTGPVTGLALTAVNKFLAYGLLHERQENIAAAVENLADAVTHARFVGVDPSSDEVVLMKIMEVLRTLMLSPVGLLLTNESVCEILQSTFRICFENRLSELLRKTAEHALNDMIQLLFTRLPTFSEENLPLLKKLKMRSTNDGSRSKRSRSSTAARSKQRQPSASSTTTSSTTVSTKTNSSSNGNAASENMARTAVAAAPADESAEQQQLQQQGEEVSTTGKATPAVAAAAAAGDTSAVTPLSPGPSSLDETKFNVDADVLARSPTGSVADLTAIPGQASTGPAEIEEGKGQGEGQTQEDVAITVTSPQGTEREVKPTPVKNDEDEPKSLGSNATDEFTNSQGVTFTPTTDMVDENGTLVPYGLPCVREVFRFLVSLTNPHDAHNQEPMIQIALSLLATAMETGAEHLDRFKCLLDLVKDDLARNLVSHLSSERIAVYSASLWLSFMLFESQRRHLKFQLEIFLNKLIEVVCTESQKVTYEHKELALEMVVRLYRIPGFLTQLYLNFDCDVYTSNVFEDLTKMLSKNAFPVTGLYSTHFLSLDALLTVIEAIEGQCQKRIAGGSNNSVEKPAKSTSVTENKKNMSNKSSGHQFGLSYVNDNNVAIREEEDEDTKFPSHEEVMALKHKKKLIQSATEQFNAKPSKGVTFMQEAGLLKSPLDPVELVTFVRDNPHLDKNQLGEYISNRKNLPVLSAFVKSFDFANQRLDESLRQFLEAFRLPGEAPLIALIMEHFSAHWQGSNPDQVADEDAAYTLAYAVIMLNVDQHNKAHTTKNDPMTQEQFTRNLRGTNGGKDHDPEMLGEIYHAIRNEEIVMPAEQVGLVKENYLWKCVLKRGTEEGARYLLAPNGYFDHDLFSIIWGPTVAALSYVFDKSGDGEVIERALHGFQRCAMIAAHYHMSDVFDNLVISLCKFTTLLTLSEPPVTFLPSFGMNAKAIFATKTVFALVQKHGDILRDGWKNVTECLLQLFKCQVLPKSLMEAEDYLEANGRVKLFREEVPVSKAESGFLNSFVSFISMSSEAAPRVRTPEEEEAAEVAAQAIKECALESLVTESKFLVSESLQELVKYLVAGSQLDDAEDGEHARLFYLEMITRITIQNRDRVPLIWTAVSDHLARLIMSSATNPPRPNTGHNSGTSTPSSPVSPTTSKASKQFMLERAVTALLRLTVRLSRKEELAPTVVQSLQIFLAMKTNTVRVVARHIAYGVYELLRNNAANIHETSDWAVILSVIEVVGTGAVLENVPKQLPGGIQMPPDQDSGHGASSESEATSASRNTSPSRMGSSNGADRGRSESISSSNNEEWIVLGDGKRKRSPVKVDVKGNRVNINQFSIVHPRQLAWHDSMSFLKCCESLAFLIRDAAHVTPANFPACVQTLRTFVEASFVPRQDETSMKESARSASKQNLRTPAGRQPPMRRAVSAPNHAHSDYDADESDSEAGPDLTSEYQHVSLQLLDLMHTLHTRAGTIHKSWAEEHPAESEEEEVNLWNVAWCPLLQGMARLCCDKRPHIRTSSLTTLTRSLLFSDLAALASFEWESAFTHVLFPMLSLLLVKSQPGEKNAMEETRTRAATLLGKVFLQHLGPLTSLQTFTALWMTILDYMEKFIKAASSDLLADAVPESLKNMLLVMDATGIFFDESGQSTEVWRQTWERLETFLPKLMVDLFGKKDRRQGQSIVQANSPPPASVKSDSSASVASTQQLQQQMQQMSVSSSSGSNLPSPAGSEPVVAPMAAAAATATAPPCVVAPVTSTTSTGSASSPSSVISPPPLSPVDPPVLPSSAFTAPAQTPSLPSAIATAKVSLPTAPQIGPMPPLPSFIPSTTLPPSTSTVGAVPPALPPTGLPISPPSLPPLPTGFQPIHGATPSTQSHVPMANPKAINPGSVVSTGGTFASYFGQVPAGSAGPNGQPLVTETPGVTMAGNILTAAFTPSLPAVGKQVVVSEQPQPPTSN